MQDFDGEVLDILSCEIGSRPEDAPTLIDLLPVLGDVRLEGRSIVIEFDSAKRALVEAFAAAERLCCPGIGWEVHGTPTPVLRVFADSTQLEVLVAMFRKEDE